MTPDLNEPASAPLSLARGLACLRALAGARTPRRFGELRTELGLSAMALTRLLSALESLGYVSRDANGHYLPGEALHALAPREDTRGFLLRRYGPALRALVASTGHSGVLIHWDGRELVILERVLAEGSVVLAPTGHIIQHLAHHPATACCVDAKRWNTALKALPVSAREDARAWLSSERNRVASSGWALGHEGHRDRIAAPLREQGGSVVGALLLGTHRHALTESAARRLAPDLLSACR